MLDKSNPFYREVKVTIPTTLAEATIAWFYSGKKQQLIDSEVGFPVYVDGVYDCTQKIQGAIDLAGGVYFPPGEYSFKETIEVRHNKVVTGKPGINYEY